MWRDNTKNNIFAWFILASLLLHCSLLLLVRLPQVRHNPPLLALKLAKIILPPHAKQIVSPPANLTDDEIDTTHINLLSDKDALTKREQLKRGNVTRPATASVARTPSTPSTPDVPSSPLVAHTPGGATADSDIFMPESEYFRLLNDSNSPSGVKKPRTASATRSTSHVGGASRTGEKQRNIALNEAQPFTKLSSTPAFALPLGSVDYLPNIPDGDITLLNTKADMFAVFVRRVALQVFAGIRKRNWQLLSMREITKLNDFVTIKADMSPQGDILTASIIESSGSWTFDMLVQDAVVQNGNDKNPPPGAISAVGGNIQFIFKARTWSVLQNAMLREQRWILLGTGLL